MSKKLILFIPLLNAKLQATIILDDKLLDYVDGGVLKNLLDGLTQQMAKLGVFFALWNWICLEVGPKYLIALAR